VLGLHPGQGLVAGDAGVVDDDVDPAMVLAQVIGNGSRGVGIADVDQQRGPVDLAGDGAEQLVVGRTIEADDVGTFVGEQLGGAPSAAMTKTETPAPTTSGKRSAEAAPPSEG
jgi:hypothetical protein